MGVARWRVFVLSVVWRGGCYAATDESFAGLDRGEEADHQPPAVSFHGAPYGGGGTHQGICV
eukprot:706932-Prorocentrum_minimum.AAC.1